MNFYNEIEPFAVEWLGNLIAFELIPAGEVCSQSIKELDPNEIRRFNQAHFFAGVAGWSEALRLAGWSGPCWTGSCPCQPFSAAGKRKGKKDDRHLWPAFYKLIAECRPPTIFGEQVASADGREWLAGVRADLEAVGYEVGAADLCAAGTGSPHIRQRLYWVANTASPRFGRRKNTRAGCGDASGGARSQQSQRSLDAGGMADNSLDGCHQRSEIAKGGDSGIRAEGNRGRLADSSDACGMADSDNVRSSEHVDQPGQRTAPPTNNATNSNCTDGLDDTERDGRRTGRNDNRGDDGQQFGSTSRTNWLGDADDSRSQRQRSGGDGPDERTAGQAGVAGAAGFWSRFSIANCTDGKARRFEPESFPLANGIPSKNVDPRLGFLRTRLQQLGHDPKTAARILREAKRNRVGRLRGFGNAIVPELAAEFVRAFMETNNAMGSK